MDKARFYLWAFYIWAGLVLIVSSIPSLSIPMEKMWNPDKIAHAGEYAIFAFLYYKYRQTAGSNTGRIIRTLFIFTLTIPILDELHQKLIPGRMYSIYDVLADIIGFLIVIAYLSYKSYCLKEKNAQ